jgi:hypothetical protein
LGFEVVGGFDGVAGYGFDGLGAIREAGGVAEVGVIGSRDQFK